MKNKVIVTDKGNYIFVLLITNVSAAMGIAFLINSYMDKSILSLIIGIFFLVSPYLLMQTPIGAYLTIVEFSEQGMLLKNPRFQRLTPWDSIEEVQVKNITSTKKVFEIQVKGSEESWKFAIMYTAKAQALFNKYYNQ